MIFKWIQLKRERNELLVKVCACLPRIQSMRLGLPKEGGCNKCSIVDRNVCVCICMCICVNKGWLYTFT